MSLIINPGSGAVPAAGNGWTNTYDRALAEAKRWLERMHDDGLTDVVLEEPGIAGDDGRWSFRFRHSVTGTACVLRTHGVDNAQAYKDDGYIFGLPRQYWCGSSSADPKLADWQTDGWLPHLTFRRDPTVAS